MAIELADNATHEDIQNYVDEVVKNVEADRAGEKGDGQRVAEATDEPTGDMTAEEDAGSEETAEKGEATGTDWLDDDLKAEVSAYGIGEQELAEFASREELERALRLFDKRALEAGRKAMAEGEPVRDGKGRFAKKEPDPKSDEENESDSAFEIKLSTDVYDEGLIGELTRMRDHYESRLSALESRLLEADSIVEEERFDTAIDGLNMPKLFGTTGNESADELQRRKDVMLQAKAQQIGLQQLTGRKVGLDTLVKRVAPTVFPEEFDKQKLKARTRKIAKQSSVRQGGGATRPTDPAETVREEMRRLYKELESGS